MQRDPFGRPTCAPGAAGRVGRIDALRRLAGALQGSSDPAERWLGAALARWLRDGGELAAVLGVLPPRGSHSTPQSIVRRDRIDALLLELAADRSDAEAERILRGAPCPPACAVLLDELRALGAPRSADAIGRARQRRDQGQP